MAREGARQTLDRRSTSVVQPTDRTGVHNLAGYAASMTTGAPVRVLHVIGRMSPGGGVQIVVRRLARHREPSRVELHIQSIRPLLPQDRLDEVDATLYGIGIRPGTNRLIDRPRILVGVARRIRSLRPDVVHLHSGTAWYAILGRLVDRRPAYLIEVHDAPGSGRHGRLSDRFEGWFVRRLGAVAVCHSTSVRDEVLQRWRPRPEQVVTFPLAVDLDVFRPGPEPATPPFVVIAVGRVVPSKRFVLAVRAVADLVERGIDARLVLVGEGPERASVAELAEELGVTDRVHLAGARYGAELAAAVRDAHVLVSTSSYEGFGLTIVEAMACGRPVVAMVAGGVVDLVDDGENGYLVGADALGDLVERLATLAADPDLRHRMGAAGEHKATSEYSGEQLAAAFTETYEALAQGTAVAGLRPKAAHAR